MTMDSEMNIYTVNDYLINKVKFEMPIKALLGIMHDRELENGIDLEACDKDKVRLAYADMLKWFVLGPITDGLIREVAMICRTTTGAR